MKRILLLLLLSVSFFGCKKDDENDNSRIAGKWRLYSMIIDRELIDCNSDKLVDEFGENGEYFGFLPSGEDKRQSSATYSLKGDELKIFYNGEEKRFKVIEMSEPLIGFEDQSHNVGVLYMFEKTTNN